MTNARSSRTALIIMTIITVVALVGATVGVVMFFSKRAEANSIRADRATVRVQQQEAVDFAKKVMTNLMTIRQETLQQDVDNLVADIGGDFAGQFTPRRDSYEAVVELNKIVAEGTVMAAGLETQTTDDAGKTQYLVILAVDQSIQNNATPSGAGAEDPSSTPATTSRPAPTPSSTAPSSTAPSSTAPSSGDPALDPGTAEPGKPEAHTYRVRVTVSKEDEGSLKVTGVDFIP